MSYAWQPDYRQPQHIHVMNGDAHDTPCVKPTYYTTTDAIYSYSSRDVPRHAVYQAAVRHRGCLISTNEERISHLHIYMQNKELPVLVSYFVMWQQSRKILLQHICGSRVMLAVAGVSWSCGIITGWAAQLPGPLVMVVSLKWCLINAIKTYLER